MYVEPPPPWEEGRQDILNALEAQMPEHTVRKPVPVVARIVWEHDGEEQLETVALGWSGQKAQQPGHRQICFSPGGDGPRDGGYTPVRHPSAGWFVHRLRAKEAIR